jgi:hypothetical protein
VQVCRQGKLGVESCPNPGDGDRVCLWDIARSICQSKKIVMNLIVVKASRYNSR